MESFHTRKLIKLTGIRNGNYLREWAETNPDSFRLARMPVFLLIGQSFDVFGTMSDADIRQWLDEAAVFFTTVDVAGLREVIQESDLGAVYAWSHEYWKTQALPEFTRRLLYGPLPPPPPQV